MIADYCKNNGINHVCIGYNKGWKDNINLCKKTQQMFVQIPFLSLIEMLTYKLKSLGITLEVTEESYTSKTDHLAREEMHYIKQSMRLGKRVKRGLFRSSTGQWINADVNGAIGMGRKSKGEVWLERFILTNSGVAPTPVRLRVWTRYSQGTEPSSNMLPRTGSSERVGLASNEQSGQSSNYAKCYNNA